jgi:putative sigma-54 modulation protein
MKIDYTGRQTEIPPELRRVVERKLAKVARLLPSITRAHVILTADKHRQVAEVSVHSRQLDLAAVEVSTNPRLSITSAIEKLIRQIDHERTKRRIRKGAASPRLAPPSSAGEREGREGREAVAGPRVIRSRKSALKPMTVYEAALEMDGRGNDVFVFRDAATERVTVLFRRKDGNLGLVEPEA